MPKQNRFAGIASLQEELVILLDLFTLLLEEGLRVCDFSFAFVELS